MAQRSKQLLESIGSLGKIDPFPAVVILVVNYAYLVFSCLHCFGT